MKKALPFLTLTIVLSTVSAYAMIGLPTKYHPLQQRILTDSMPVDQNITLRWDLYPEPVWVFANHSGFIFTRDNVMLDLNGHKIMHDSGGKAPGDDAIIVEGRNGVTVKNGEIGPSFELGVYVLDSSNVNIINMNVSDIAGRGIEIERIAAPTRNITVSHNIVGGCDFQGILLRGVDCGNVSDNVVSTCGSSGVMLYASSNCSVSRNVVSGGCDPFGIDAQFSNGNVISNNTLSGNNKGLELKQSSSNVIFHNDFVDNINGQLEVSQSTSTWNLSYPCGGNFWSDCNGEDKLSGIYQNVSGSDGIIDQPYVFNGEILDKQPLLNQWGTALRVLDIAWNITQARVPSKMTCPVALYSDSSITDFDFNETLKKLSFSTENGTFCRVIIAKDVLEGALSCSVDDAVKDVNLNWDGTHTFVGITYSNDSHKVEITGERAIRIVGDVNNDGVVDILDIFQVAKNFGKENG